MNLREWRGKRQSGEEITLKSGLVLTCKRVDLMDLAANGEIPTPLLSVVQQIMNSADGSTFKFDIAELPRITQLVNCVVKAAVVAPAIADEPSETHLGLNELTFTERMEIFSWANGTASQLAPFSGESAGGLPTP